MANRKKKGRPVSGWVVLDKPVGMTSTQAVSAVKYLFKAQKAGHAGTLDPLASGCLPIALGEATKAMPQVVDGDKAYRFTVTWGGESDTDDTEGRIVATSDKRPSREAIEAAMEDFIGEIEQTPPAFSAVKINGERAYDLARDGETVELASRIVRIDSFDLIDIPDARPRHIRDRLRQGHLCALARPRPRAQARLLRPCVGASPALGRTVCRGDAAPAQRGSRHGGGKRRGGVRRLPAADRSSPLRPHRRAPS